MTEARAVRLKPDTTCDCYVLKPDTTCDYYVLKPDTRCDYVLLTTDRRKPARNAWAWARPM